MVKAGSATEAPVLERGSHAVSVNRLGVGGEEVTFDQDVSKCAYSVTPGGGQPIYSAGVQGPLFVTVNPKFDPATVLVTTGHYKESTFSVEALDVSFHLIVAC